MWTISSSRVKPAALLLLTMILGCGSAADGPRTATSVAATAPDAPEPALADEPRGKDAQPNYGPIDLASVRVRAMDEQLARYAGQEFVRNARDPVAVEAVTTSDLPLPLGASSPVLIINGQVYPDTWFIRPNRLVAFVADRASLRETNNAEAMWIGAETTTRSRQPMPFRPNGG